MKPLHHLTFLILASLAAAFLVSCVYSRDDDERPGSTGVREYLEELGKTLEPLSEATEAWTVLSEEQAKANTSTLSRDEAFAMVQALRDAAERAYLHAAAAAKAFQVKSPPERCVEMHRGTLESIQLTERAFLEMKGYFEALLASGIGNVESLNRANDLLNEADRAKIGLEGLLEGCTS